MNGGTNQACLSCMVPIFAPAFQNVVLIVLFFWFPCFVYGVLHGLLMVLAC